MHLVRRRRRTAVIFGVLLPLAAAGIVSAAWPAAAATGPALAVDVSADRHPISRDIYGMNFADEALARDLKLPVRRWGGNATTRYNYALDETNRGSDWYFENVPGNADPAQLPNGSETDVFVDQDRRTGTSTLLTLPLIGWVPKARDFTCGFSIAKYGAQQQNDSQFRPDCGNGVKSDGSNVTGNDPHDTSVEAGTAYITAWLNHLTTRYGAAASGGVKYYNLDNEADIWHATHRDVHPKGATYDEMRDQTYAIAAALKAADPAALTLGPTGWGWSSITLSGSDQQTCNAIGGSCWSNPPDKAAHGGVDFGAWYLQQMKAYEQAHGVRLVDYYDNHWYPQESGVAFGNGNDPTTNALRLRSTRNLWDPTYVDESWINTQTQLIPRMKQLVAANYPGTKTAITEYNWGALDSINGALAQADILGIFGREGLDLATLWAPPSATQPGAFAFRMYLNYDGSGSSFGSTAVRATSADQSQLAAYAADRSDGATTIMVVNKTGNDLSTSVSLSGRALPAAAQVFRYSAANLSAIVRAADVPVASSAVSTTFPANSITLLVLPASSGPPPSTTPPPTTSSSRPPSSPPPSSSSSSPVGACTASYRIIGQWQGGFQAEVTVKAGTRAINGWTTTWTFANGQRVTQLWNGALTQSGSSVTVKNVSYNGSLPANGSTTFGFLGSWSGTNAVPTLGCTSP
jgi:hypothetical protein